MSITTRAPYLAAYDIASPRRLRSALRVLKGYAAGRQKSVFECFLTPAEVQQLLDEIGEIIEERKDRFFLIRLQPGQPIHTLGIGVPMADPDWFYIG